MKPNILLDIPFDVDLNLLLKNLHIKEGNTQEARIRELVDAALTIGKPKGMFKEVYIESKDDHSILVDGFRFTSRVLRVNLDEVHRIFPYVITCGSELSAWADANTDILDNYFMNAINEMVLRSARKHVFSLIDEKYGLAHAANMNPGSLQDWPIREQKQLFSLLGNVQEAIGVLLTESCLMMPVKSVSGVRFPKEGTYENCQLCPRDNCPGRKAAYEKNLYDEKYKLR